MLEVKSTVGTTEITNNINSQRMLCVLFTYNHSLGLPATVNILETYSLKIVNSYFIRSIESNIYYNSKPGFILININTHKRIVDCYSTLAKLYHQIESVIHSYNTQGYKVIFIRVKALHFTKCLNRL